MAETTQHNFQRGIPVSPPQNLANWPPRSRRWQYCLIGAGAVLLVFLVAGGVFLAKYLQLRGRAPAASSGREAEPAEKKSATPAGKPAKPGPGEVSIARTQHELFLQTIAVLTVGHLYQTYLNLGLLDDGMEIDLYDKDEAIKMLGDVTHTLNVVDRQLARLEDSKLGPDDEKDVGHVRMLSGLLRQQAKELKAYWEDPSEAQGLKYKKAREAAWSGIKPLLGIDEK